MSEKYSIPEPNSLDSMEGVENQKYIEAEKELKISPEEIDFDMDKVEKEVFDKIMDINQSGIGVAGVTVNEKILKTDERGFHVPDRTKFVPIRELAKSVLSSGLLGSRGLISDGENDLGLSYEENLKQRWVSSRKKGYGGNLFVNIVERDIKEVSKSWATGSGSENELIGVLMDLSSFKEQIPINAYGWPNTKDKRLQDETNYKHGKGRAKHYRSYWSKSGGDIVRLLDLLGEDFESINYEELIEILKRNQEKHNLLNMTKEQYEQLVEEVEKTGSMKELFQSKNIRDTSEGFVVSHRVAPRYIKGITLHQGQHYSRESLIHELVEAMKETTKKKKRDSFLPIYNIFGDLLWPKRISYKNLLKVIDKTMTVEEAEELGLSKEDVEEKLQELDPRLITDEKRRIEYLKSEGFD